MFIKQNFNFLFFLIWIRVAHYSRFLLSRMQLHKNVANYAPVAIGLGSIPIIIHPIDTFTDYLMDNTFRKIFQSE